MISKIRAKFYSPERMGLPALNSQLSHAAVRQWRGLSAFFRIVWQFCPSVLDGEIRTDRDEQALLSFGSGSRRCGCLAE